MPKRKTPKIKKNQKLLFVCPNDGHIDQTDVDVWCNRCHKDDMIQKDGMYLCPSCLINMEGNFTCRICGSEKVKLAKVKKSKTKEK